MRAMAKKTKTTTRARTTLKVLATTLRAAPPQHRDLMVTSKVSSIRRRRYKMSVPSRSSSTTRHWWACLKTRDWTTRKILTPWLRSHCSLATNWTRHSAWSPHRLIATLTSSSDKSTRSQISSKQVNRKVKTTKTTRKTKLISIGKESHSGATKSYSKVVRVSCWSSETYRTRSTIKRLSKIVCSTISLTAR